MIKNHRLGNLCDIDCLQGSPSDDDEQAFFGCDSDFANVWSSVDLELGEFCLIDSEHPIFGIRILDILSGTFDRRFLTSLSAGLVSGFRSFRPSHFLVSLSCSAC